MADEASAIAKVALIQDTLNAMVEMAMYEPIDMGQAVPAACYDDVVKGLAEGHGTHAVAALVRTTTRQPVDPASVGRLQRRLARIEALKAAAGNEREKAAGLAVAYVSLNDALETLHALNAQLYKTGALGPGTSDCEFARLVAVQKTQVATIKLLNAQIRTG